MNWRQALQRSYRTLYRAQSCWIPETGQNLLGSVMDRKTFLISLCAPIVAVFIPSASAPKKPFILGLDGQRHYFEPGNMESFVTALKHPKGGFHPDTFAVPENPIAYQGSSGQIFMRPSNHTSFGKPF